ncbi:MAG: 5-dehydro-4-deoxy-D-glucuronate isomerase [Calditrichota bacterium]
MKSIAIPDAVRFKALQTEDVRKNYLLDTLMQPGKVELAYIDMERTVLGGVVPQDKSLDLPNPELLRATSFTERREIGIMNVGGVGSIVVDEDRYDMAFRDALYIGRGDHSVSFESSDSNNPACFYLVSYPAHAEYPVRHAKVSDAEPLHLGSAEESNKRTIYKYIFNGGIESCQLVLGFTEMHPGSVWNTMPAHYHSRRSEVYFYFGLPENSVVFHLMGEPDETRHIVVRNQQAAISPPWSIHAGAATSNYSFIWAMGGENQDYTDMIPVDMNKIR